MSTTTNQPDEEYLFYRINQENLHYVGQLKHKQQETKLSRFCILITRHILLFFESFLHMDYFDKRLQLNLMIEPRFDDFSANQNNSNAKNTWKKLKRQLTRPHALYFVAGSLWITTNVVLQYQLDLVWYKLSHSYDKFDNETVRYLQQMFNLTGKRMDTIGAPLRNAHFASEVGYMYIVLISTFTYFHGAIQMATRLAINFPLARLLLDPERECSFISKMILNEIIKFRTSSLQFIYSGYFQRPNKQTELSSDFSLPRPSSIQAINVTNHLASDNGILLKELNKMATNGHLRPLIWSNKYARRLPEMFGVFIITLVVFIYLLFLIGTVIFFSTNPNFHLHTEPMDLIYALNATFMMTYMILAVVYYISFFFFDSAEQLIYIDMLADLLGKTAQKSDKYLVELLQVLNSKWLGGDHKKCTIIANYRKRVNVDLLYAIIHYRIFVARSKQSRQATRFLLMTATSLLFVMPVMVRSHLPYMDVLNEVKLVASFFCLASVVLMDILVLPVCYIHEVSLRLEKSMSSLMAHAMHTMEIDKCKQLRRLRKSWLISNHHQHHQLAPVSIYNKYLICLIRKELDNPEELTGQFAVKTCGIEFTLPTLCQIHFWFGLIVLAITSNVNSDENTFVIRILNDPFGLMT